MYMFLMLGHGAALRCSIPYCIVSCTGQARHVMDTAGAPFARCHALQRRQLRGQWYLLPCKLMYGQQACRMLTGLPATPLCTSLATSHLAAPYALFRVALPCLHIPSFQSTFPVSS